MLAVLAAGLAAQGNAVPGLDVRLYEIPDMAYYGRQGGILPAGEAGFMVGHSISNCGSVNVPWVAVSGGVMVDTYPKIAFLLARESGGRMVQISGQGHSKHSVAPYNFASGPCQPCTTAGGPFFYVGCADTYGSNTNATQFHLGPNREIDPWLGTWNPVGSYFDAGDPAVAGAAATDGVRSLTSTMVGAFGPVKNRIVVRESELVGDALYYAQATAVIQGEPVAARGDNVRSRPVSIVAAGGGWIAGTYGASTPGSVLARWSGATWDVGGNGQDDGRFLVACKVTTPAPGTWHYEYAVHNLDNARAAATFRLPVDALATITNVGCRDVDGDPLNDWTWTRAGGELAFAAGAGNALEWNTIYNVWFDCSIPPGQANASLDAARPGPGALTVAVPCLAPIGTAVARVESLGTACGACVAAHYEQFSQPAAFDLAGRSMTLSFGGGAYTVAETGAGFAPIAGAALALNDDSETTVALPFALPYPGGTTTTLRVCSNGFVSPAASNGTSHVPVAAALLAGAPRWCGAWHDFQPNAAGSGPVLFAATASEAQITWNGVANYGGSGSSTFQLRFRPDGTVHVAWGAMAATGNGYLVGWSPGATERDPGSVDLSAALSSPVALCAPTFNGVRLAASAPPLLGATIQWQTSGLPPSAVFAALLLSAQRALPPLDLTALGMPGCELHALAPIADAYLPTGASAQQPLAIPSDPGLLGFVVVGQALAFAPPLNAAGLVLSNGLALALGL